MKSLYDADYRYTVAGSDLDSETSIALKDIFQKYIDAGYSPREIAHVMNATILDFELMDVLMRKPVII